MQPIVMAAATALCASTSHGVTYFLTIQFQLWQRILAVSQKLFCTWYFTWYC
jgi:hypothetical protein